MGTIYRHGYYNIAATAALDGIHGCFMERDPVRTLPIVTVEEGPQPTTFGQVSRKISEYWSGIRRNNYGASDLLPRGSYMYADPLLWERGITEFAPWRSSLGCARAVPCTQNPSSRCEPDLLCAHRTPSLRDLPGWPARHHVEECLV
jgi:hypothetical protein